MDLTTVFKLFNVDNHKNRFILLIFIRIIIMIIAFIVNKKMKK